MPSLPLSEAAALAGRHAWWEQRLFELTGRWAAGSAIAEVTVALGVQARVHATRAEQWYRRLPVLAGWDPDVLTAAPHPAQPAAVERMGQEVTSSLDQLVAIHRVLLPARLAAYRAHLECTSPVCDAPTVRVLEAVVSALPQEIDAGEQLLGRLRDRDGVDRRPAAEKRCRDLLRLS